MEGSPAEAALRQARGLGGRKITQWCHHFYSKTGCQRGQFCTFAHEPGHIGQIHLNRDQWVSTHKMVLCKHFAAGKQCGSGCRFAHGLAEMGTLVKNSQAGTGGHDEISMPCAMVQTRKVVADHRIPRASKNDAWESWKSGDRWWWGWRSKEGNCWSGEDWNKTEERTKTKSKERSEELGIDSGEAKTEERTETKSEEWAEIKEECTRSGGWGSIKASGVSDQECQECQELTERKERGRPPLPLPGSDSRGCAHAPRGPCIRHKGHLWILGSMRKTDEHGCVCVGGGLGRSGWGGQDGPEPKENYAHALRWGESWF